MWTGHDCQMNEDECESNPCQNEGECIDGFGTFQCSCQPGWTGQLISSCTQICYRWSLIRFYFFYIGITCDVGINECASNPCRNDGTCIDKVNGYACQCQDGVTGVCHINEWPLDVQYYSPLWFNPVYTTLGLNCENDFNECASNPCLNKGHCVDKYGYFLCHCAPGWTGQSVEEYCVILIFQWKLPCVIYYVENFRPEMRDQYWWMCKWSLQEYWNMWGWHWPVQMHLPFRSLWFVFHWAIVMFES